MLKPMNIYVQKPGIDIGTLHIYAEKKLRKEIREHNNDGSSGGLFFYWDAVKIVEDMLFINEAEKGFVPKYKIISPIEELTHALGFKAVPIEQDNYTYDNSIEELTHA